MPEDFKISHAAAAAFLFICWLGYSKILRIFKREPLNNQLIVARSRWIKSLSSRAALPFDAILLGHIVNSVTFFGSATLIVLAGIFSAFVNLDNFHRTVAELHINEATSFEMFAWQFSLLAVVISVCFFSFTYALRKMVYVIALVAALPSDEPTSCDQEGMVRHTTTVLTEAVKTFNFGIRGYYYSISALFLMLSPLASIIASSFVTVILIYRQTQTKTSRAIEGYVKAVNGRET